VPPGRDAVLHSAARTLPSRLPAERQQ